MTKTQTGMAVLMEASNYSKHGRPQKVDKCTGWSYRIINNAYHRNLLSCSITLRVRSDQSNWSAASAFGYHVGRNSSNGQEPGRRHHTEEATKRCGDWKGWETVSRVDTHGSLRRSSHVQDVALAPLSHPGQPWPSSTRLLPRPNQQRRRLRHKQHLHYNRR